MSKKIAALILLLIIVLGGISGWIFSHFLIPRLSAIPFLVKYNLAPPNGPVVINTTQQIHVNEGSDGIAAIQKVKPWTVSLVNSKGQVLAGGIIVSSDGFIATTNVITPATAIYAVLNDGTVLQASYQAADPASNLVLLKAQGNNLPTASFGDPKSLQLGQRMIVLMPSLGEYQSTENLTSLSSELRNQDYTNVLSSDRLNQTFAVADLGNTPEGSAVLSLDSNIEGIYSKTGIISANIIQSALNSYFNNANKITRNSFGIYYQYIPKALASIDQVQEGVVVRQPDSKTPAVVQNSPAASAGLQANDIIYKINGTQINFDNSFEQLINNYAPGAVINLSVLRGKNQIKINLTLGSR